MQNKNGDSEVTNNESFTKYFNKKLIEDTTDFTKNKLIQIENYLDEILLHEEKKYDEILSNYIIQSKLLLEEEIENHKILKKLIKILKSQ